MSLSVAQSDLIGRTCKYLLLALGKDVFTPALHEWVYTTSGHPLPVAAHTPQPVFTPLDIPPLKYL